MILCPIRPHTGGDCYCGGEKMNDSIIYYGGTIMKVADLTTDELKELIGKIIEDKFRELIDPDLGLELRDDFVCKLEASIKSKERISFDDVKKKLDLN
jgi:methenyltetrahydromethanopterin cyclohydrolase